MGRQRAVRHQRLVDQYFESAAGLWRDIYAQPTVYGRIHQQRQAIALRWIDGLALSIGAAVLEIGCGAGFMSAALAGRGFEVTATDTVPAMIALTHQLAVRRNLSARLRTTIADVQDLPFADGSYSVVLGLGVLPWVHAPQRAVSEMARVLRPGGYLLVNVDNVFRLHYMLDPHLNPALAGVRADVRRWLVRAGIVHGPGGPGLARLDSPRRFDALLDHAGFEKVRGTTVGFGPFTFWNRPILTERAGLQVHSTLQRLADRDLPLISSLGAQYLVLARKR